MAVRRSKNGLQKKYSVFSIDVEELPFAVTEFLMNGDLGLNQTFKVGWIVMMVMEAECHGETGGVGMLL